MAGDLISPWGHDLLPLALVSQTPTKPILIRSWQAPFRSWGDHAHLLELNHPDGGVVFSAVAGLGVWDIPKGNWGNG